MRYDDFDYFVRHDPGRDRPAELWRQVGERLEYFSLVDWRWKWHETGATLGPHPATRFPITSTEAATLERDRQTFVRYFLCDSSAAAALGHPPDPSDEPTLVYRYRRLPTIGEIFDEGAWEETSTVSRYLNPGPDEPPCLREVDRDTAERTIQQLYGVTGATDIGITDT